MFKYRILFLLSVTLTFAVGIWVMYAALCFHVLGSDSTLVYNPSIHKRITVQTNVCLQTIKRDLNIECKDVACDLDILCRDVV